MERCYRARGMLPLLRPISRDGNICLLSMLPIIGLSHDDGNNDGYLDSLVPIFFVTLLPLLLLKDKKNIEEGVYPFQGVLGNRGNNGFMVTEP